MKEGFRPDKRMRIPKPDEVEEKIDKGRRGFLKGAMGGAMGLAAAAALGDSIIDAHPTDNPRANTERFPEVNAYLDETIEKIQGVLNSRAGKDAREGRGKNAVEMILDTIAVPFKPALLRGTKYDPTLLESFGVQLMYNGLPADGMRVSIHPITNNPELPFVKIGQRGYGNGCYWNNAHTVLTAKHVIQGMFGEKISFSNDPDKDIGFARVPDEFTAKDSSRIVKDDPTLNDAQIDTAFVAMNGSDPDVTSDESGRKLWAGVALKVTPGLAKALNIADVEGKFILILPQGEAQPNVLTSGNPQLVPIRQMSLKQKFNKLRPPAFGMSGNMIFMYRKNGTQAPAGIFSGVVPYKIHDKIFDILVFSGIEDIRRVEKEREPRVIPGVQDSPRVAKK